MHTPSVEKDRVLSSHRGLPHRLGSGCCLGHTLACTHIAVGPALDGHWELPPWAALSVCLSVTMRWGMPRVRASPEAPRAVGWASPPIHPRVCTTQYVPVESRARRDRGRTWTWRERPSCGCCVLQCGPRNALPSCQGSLAAGYPPVDVHWPLCCPCAGVSGARHPQTGPGHCGAALLRSQ